MPTLTSTTPETAYRALSHAAEQMGRNNFVKLPDKVKARMAKGKAPANWPTQAHREVVDAMLDVMNDRISVNDAMVLLWRSDVEAQRFGH